MTTSLQTPKPFLIPDLLGKIDAFRGLASKSLDPDLRRRRGQFFTPQSIAKFMVTLFRNRKKHIKLLDAGAGTGILSAALVQQQLSRKQLPKSIAVTAFEIDPLLRKYLEDTYLL